MTDDLTRRGFMGLLAAIGAAPVAVVRITEAQPQAKTTTKQPPQDRVTVEWPAHLPQLQMRWHNEWLTMGQVQEIEGPVMDGALGLADVKTWDQATTLLHANRSAMHVKLTPQIELRAQAAMNSAIGAADVPQWRLVLPAPGLDRRSVWEFHAVLTQTWFTAYAAEPGVHEVVLELVGKATYTMEEA